MALIKNFYAPKLLLCCLLLCLGCSLDKDKVTEEKYKFQDCKLLSRYCLSYQSLIQYQETNLLKLSWGSDKTYKFVSEADTLIIRIYLSKITQSDSISFFKNFDNTIRKKSNFYGMPYPEIKSADYFFNGYMLYYAQLKTLEYYGISKNIEDKNNVFSISLESSPGFSDTIELRKKNFMEIIRTINIYKSH